MEEVKSKPFLFIFKILFLLFLSVIFCFLMVRASLLDKGISGKSLVQRYRGIEIRTTLVDDRIQSRLVEGNSVEFILNEKCEVEGLKLKIDGEDIQYRQVERVVEDGRVEKNDLFAYILYGPEAGKDSMTGPEKIEFKFYRGKISPFIDFNYPLYPTLKLTADRLGLKLPHRTFVVLNGTGGSTCEFFCYLEDESSSSEEVSPDPCLPSFDQVLEIHHKDQHFTALMDLAEKYARRFDFEKAEKAYLKALSLPGARDYEQLISLYLSTNQTAKARKFLLARLDRSPMKFDLYLALARVYFFEGRYEEAITAARTSQKLNPERGMYKSYAILGQAYLKQRNFIEAIKAFSRAATLAEKECQEAEALSRSFFYRPEDELTDLDCRLSRLPYEQAIIYALTALEEYEQAGRRVEALLKVPGQRPEFYGWLSFISAGQGQKEKALEMAASCLSLFRRRGIGAAISQGEIYPQIITVQKNAPAERAGLKVGDRIIAVNDRDLRLYRGQEDPAQAVIKFLRSEEKVNLLIHRPCSPELKEIEVKLEEFLPEEAAPVIRLKELVASSSQKVDQASLSQLLDEFYEKLRL